MNTFIISEGKNEGLNKETYGNRGESKNQELRET